MDTVYQLWQLQRFLNGPLFVSLMKLHERRTSTAEGCVGIEWTKVEVNK